MKMEHISFPNSTYRQQHIVVYLDSFPLSRVLRDRQARLASLPAHAFGRLQSQTGEEFDALLPSRGDAAQSVLDRAFKGEL